MRRRLLPLACLVLALAATVALAACGEEEELEVVEGEALELGDLSYIVQLTRPLNLDDREDADYLVGQREPGADQQYLGVFLRIENEGDSAAAIPEEFEIRDTRDRSYAPVESESPHALELGGTIEPEGVVPVPDTTAAYGPIRGAMILFLIDRASAEDRPIELEVPGEAGETGLVELDI
jgi:hypothetical protein